MNRNIDYIIDEDSAGLRVEQFLRRKRYSGQNLSEIKRMPKSILVNGVHYYMRQELSKGDHLQVRICETQNSEKIPPTKLPLDIIYEDEDLLVLNKPAGMPIHPSLNNYTNSIANALAYYFQSQGKPFIFRCCNRLDRDTSGLTIVSKHLVSGSILSDMTKYREVHREYLAIARGSVTHYKVVKEANGHSLVSLRLETGRTHQIRIHMKYLGYPLIGDYLYNPDMEYMTRQALHSHHMEFTHPITGEHMSFTAPLPEDMARVMQE